MTEKQRFDNEFKGNAVNLATKSDRPVSQIARELGINANTLYNWIHRSQVDDNGQVVTDSEVTKLRRELSNVREERDILKKAIAIFSKQPNRNVSL